MESAQLTDPGYHRLFLSIWWEKKMFLYFVKNSEIWHGAGFLQKGRAAQYLLEFDGLEMSARRAQTQLTCLTWMSKIWIRGTVKCHLEKQESELSSRREPGLCKRAEETKWLLFLSKMRSGDQRRVHCWVSVPEMMLVLLWQLFDSLYLAIDMSWDEMRWDEMNIPFITHSLS